VIVSWLPCQCGPARAALARGSGHRTIACRAPGCEYVCYEPPHEPGPGEGVALALRWPTVAGAMAGAVIMTEAVPDRPARGELSGSARSRGRL